MASVSDLAARLRLTLVVSQAEAAPRTVMGLAEKAFGGGATALQLREKSLCGREFFALAQALATFCRERGKLFIVNDRLDIAMASGADGVHLGQTDLPAGPARELLGPGRLLGISAATGAEGREALDAGADYLGVGAIVRTDSKTEADELDPAQVPRLIALGLPTVAIGGISAHNAGGVWAMGFTGLAVISALTRSADPAATARDLLRGAPKG
ncbi:MAG: thiamine phosphate synthase [Deltaproteobacteria bacterium]|jgi:thiamine-phosphate pyrophosphorylase|nr:thiamine phosphate synthase [Deltaproteobacteria bacterium]